MGEQAILPGAGFHLTPVVAFPISGDSFECPLDELEMVSAGFSCGRASALSS